MNSDLDELERKIREARESNLEGGSGAKNRSNSGDKAGIQAGMEFTASIALSTFIGYQLDQWLGTLPLFLILLFFLGVSAGFWTLYKLSQKAGGNVGYSQLHEQEKTANKAPDKD